MSDEDISLRNYYRIINEERNYECLECYTPFEEIPLTAIEPYQQGVCKIKLKGLCKHPKCISIQHKLMYVCTGPCHSFRFDKPNRILQNRQHIRKCLRVLEEGRDDDNDNGVIVNQEDTSDIDINLREYCCIINKERNYVFRTSVTPPSVTD